jgi:hypothetical protein
MCGIWSMTMAIKAVVDKLEDVPEQYRDLYTERNGKFEVSGIEGIRTDADVTRLSSALEKERKDHKTVKQTLTTILGDRKPEDVVTLLDRIPELELAAEGKVDDNKINEMVEKRIGAKLGPVQRQLQQLTTQNAEKDQIITAFQTKERTRTIHDHVREAINKTQGFQVAAVEDALLFAERMLEVTEEGKVVTKDNVGVTPGVDAVVWLTDMQQRKPHWWGPSQGGGAGGNNGKGGSSGDNPWTHENWNMTKQGEMYKANPARAEQLAKSAGTKIGGMRPAARK